MSWHTPTSREGAVWGTGGPVVEPNGGLWVSNGNGAAGPGDPYDGSDSVTALSPVLHRNGYFAPASWAADNASDLDLGSTEPVIAAGDPNTAFIVGKRGVGYLLSTAHLGGIGHERASLAICRAFGGTATSGSMVYEPCQSGGMAAVYVNAADAEDRHSLARAGRRQRVAGPRRRRGLGHRLLPERRRQRHPVRAELGHRRDQEQDRDRRGPAALLVALAGGGHRLRRHADRRDRRQRRLRKRTGREKQKVRSR